MHCIPLLSAQNTLLPLSLLAPAPVVHLFLWLSNSRHLAFRAPLGYHGFRAGAVSKYILQWFLRSDFRSLGSFLVNCPGETARGLASSSRELESYIEHARRVDAARAGDRRVTPRPVRCGRFIISGQLPCRPGTFNASPRPGLPACLPALPLTAIGGDHATGQ